MFFKNKSKYNIITCTTETKYGEKECYNALLMKLYPIICAVVVQRSFNMKNLQYLDSAVASNCENVL